MARGTDQSNELQIHSMRGAQDGAILETGKSIANRLDSIAETPQNNIFRRIQRKATALLAVGAIALSGAAMAACASPEPADYRPSAQPAKEKIEPGLDRVQYKLNTVTVSGDLVDDPSEFATKSESERPLAETPETEVEFFGRDLGDSFEVTAFRIKVDNPLKPREFEDVAEDLKEYDGNEKELLDNIEKETEREMTEQALAVEGTPPPVELEVGLADLESYGTSMYSGSRYWINANPMFREMEILQDGTWQSRNLAQPVQLSKGQQYVLTVIYEEKHEDYRGLVNNYGLAERTAAQVPVTFNTEK